MYGQQSAATTAYSQSQTTQRPTAVIHYTIYLPNGESLSSHESGYPYRYDVESDQVLPGLREAVSSMETGETRRIQLTPDQAFGEFRSDRIIEAAYQNIYSPDELNTGTPVRLRSNGGETQAFVREEREETLVFDMNHPLAGLELTIDVTLLGYE